MLARTLMTMMLLATFGCEEPAPAVVERKSSFIGEWVSVGTAREEQIKVLFSKDGAVTITSGGRAPVSYRYRVEPIDAWYSRRAKEVKMPKAKVAEVFPSVTYVVTAFEKGRPDAFDPSRNFFYDEAGDRLSVSGMVEFRRVK